MSNGPPLDLEHRALDRALGEVEFLAQKRTFGPAAKRFTEFRRALELHLEEEETVTFPDFEHRTGDPDRALPIIRAQHRDLERALERLHAALTRADYGAFCTSLTELDHLLKTHQATEERLLSPKLAGHPAP